jgi:Phospholipase_D-nuclease N-terminal
VDDDHLLRVRDLDLAADPRSRGQLQPEGPFRWAKAGWTVFVIFLPLLGVLVYMIARPPEDSGLMSRVT